MKRTILAAGLAATALGLGAAGPAAATNPPSPTIVRQHLTPSSPELARCLPRGARATLRVALTTEEKGFDTVTLNARRLPPDTSFTLFLLEQAGPPFGAAEYFGDFTTNRHGSATARFRLIAEEAFASTLVNGERVRVDLDQTGFWFADEAADDFCEAIPQGLVTPFDGDGRAGVQAFNSANTVALP